MANTKGITTATRAEVKRLRSELAIIGSNKAQIVHSANNLFDAYGPDAAREARFDAAMVAIAADRQRVLGKIDALLGKTAAQAAAQAAAQTAA